MASAESQITSLMASNNEFLKSVLEPESGPAHIPDQNMAASILKSVNQSTTITSAGTNEYLFHIPFHSPYRRIRVYGRDTITNTYNFLFNIDQTEDLRLNFKKLRFVSASLSFKSSTVTGNTFTVSGNFSAVSVQDLPNLRNLSYDTLTAFKRDNTSFLSNIPAADGIICLAAPDEDLEFWEPAVGIPSQLTTQGDQVYSEGSALKTSYQGSSAFLASASFTSLNIFTTGGAPLFRDNLWGHFKIKGRYTYAAAASVPQLNAQTTINVVVRRADPVSFNVTLVTRQFFMSQVIGPNSTAFANQTVDIDLDLYTEEEVENIFIVQTAPAGSTFTPTAASAYMHIIAYDVNRFGVQEPACVVAVRSLGTGQQISLTGVANYEAMPNSDLAQNVPTEFSYFKDPKDLAVAQAIFQNRRRFGIELVYTLPHYNKLSFDRRGFYNRERAMVNASSVNADISAWYHGSVKPFLRKVAPMLGGLGGGAIGSMFGEPSRGAMIGQSLGDALSKTVFASDSNLQQKSSVSRPVVYSASTGLIIKLEKLRGLCLDLEAEEEDIDTEDEEEVWKNPGEYDVLSNYPEFNPTLDQRFYRISDSDPASPSNNSQLEWSAWEAGEDEPIMTSYLVKQDGDIPNYSFRREKCEEEWPGVTFFTSEVVKEVKASSSFGSMELDEIPDLENLPLPPVLSAPMATPAIDKSTDRVHPKSLGLGGFSNRWHDRCVQWIATRQLGELSNAVRDPTFALSAMFAVVGDNDKPLPPVSVYATNVPLLQGVDRSSDYVPVVYINRSMNDDARFFVDIGLLDADGTTKIDEVLTMIMSTPLYALFAKTTERIYLSLSRAVSVSGTSFHAAVGAIFNFCAPNLMYTGSDVALVRSLFAKLRVAGYYNVMLIIVGPDEEKDPDYRKFVSRGAIAVGYPGAMLSTKHFAISCQSIDEMSALTVAIAKTGGSKITYMTKEEKEQSTKTSLEKGELQLNPKQVINTPTKSYGYDFTTTAPGTYVNKFMKGIIHNKVPITTVKAMYENPSANPAWRPRYASLAAILAAAEAAMAKLTGANPKKKKKGSTKTAISESFWDELGPKDEV